MSVRKRKWTTRSGEAKEAWIVDYFDQQGARHIHTFARKKDADEYHDKVKVDVRQGIHTAASKTSPSRRPRTTGSPTSSWKAASGPPSRAIASTSSCTSSRGSVGRSWRS